MARSKREEEVQAVSQLVTDFGHYDLQKRLQSTDSLPRIAQAIGGYRVRKELIPFIRNELIYDLSEVAMALLDVVGGLGEACGPAQLLVVLPILEDLLEHEDELPRQKAILKYTELVVKTEVGKHEVILTASFKKVLSSDYDEPKEAFCSAVAAAFGKFSAPVQIELLGQYQGMAESPSVVQRRHASVHSARLVQWLESAEAGILRIVETLFKDKDYNNKIHLIATVINLAKLKQGPTLQAYFNLITYQFSFRIRYEFIAQIYKLAAALKKEGFKSCLTYYVKYLNDVEPYIRSVACLKLKDLVGYLYAEDIIVRVLPALKTIPYDSKVFVRNALASSLLWLCASVSRKQTAELILPKCLQLLKDEDEQVRLTAFREVHLLCDALGIETLTQAILPLVFELLYHPRWRMRIEGLRVFVYLCEASHPDALNYRYYKVLFDFLQDKSSAGRAEALQALSRLLRKFGQPWFDKNIVPRLLSFAASPNFLHRQILLFAIECLDKVLTEPTCRLFLATFLLLARDPIANVRIAAVKALPTLYLHFKDKDREPFKKVLFALREDKDINVKELAFKVGHDL